MRRHFRLSKCMVPGRVSVGKISFFRSADIPRGIGSRNSAGRPASHRIGANNHSSPQIGDVEGINAIAGSVCSPANSEETCVCFA